MKKIIPALLVLVVLLSSCLVGRKYTRPDLEVPTSYINGDSVVTNPNTLAVATDSTFAGSNSLLATADTVNKVEWFTLFQDTVLNSLIQQALDTNTNLQIAALRIDQSRNSYRIARSRIFPSFGYSAVADLSTGGDENFQLMGTASWELDFWGKLRHAKRAAYADMLASEEGMKVVKTTLVSDVASLYFEMRDLDNRMDVSKQTLESRQIYYNMVSERFRMGEVAELDKLQAEQQLAIVEATMQSLERQLDYTERSLNILLNQNPQKVQRGLWNEEQTEIPEIPAGLPSTLIEQRPDIVAAERTLEAETERIGVANSMRFPSFSLTGLFGLASTDLTNILSADALLGGLTGSIVGPIFEFGKNKRRVEIQRMEAEIAVNNYLFTYRNALGEVENALVSIETYRREYEARLRQTEASRKALMLTKAKYDNGYSSYLEVLISESYTFDAEMQLSITKAQQLSATVGLYRALGGGW